MPFADLNGIFLALEELVRGAIGTVFALPALFWLAALIGAIRTRARVPRLAHLPPAPPERCGKVSIIVPACDEAQTIGPALQSLLALDYPDLQIVIIDDRSRDGTGDVATRAAGGDPRVLIERIDHLPDGWLGKVHALHRGVARADGEWLLFADADVILAPSALRKAVGCCDAAGYDLLSGLPEIMPSRSLADVVIDFIGPLSAALYQPWKVSDPADDLALAAGAFILIRRSAFAKTPGFEWLQLEVADDQGLALLLKRHGGRLGFVNLVGEVFLPLYPSLADMTRKTQKNWFGIAGRFSLRRLLVAAYGVLYLAFAPLFGLIGWIGIPVWCEVACAAGIVLMAASSLLTAHTSARPWLSAALSWLGAVLVAYQMVYAGTVGALRGGISWRGVFYPSDLLKSRQRWRM